MRHCGTKQRLASQHDEESTTGVMVTWLQGYVWPWESAGRVWRDQHRATVCASSEVVTLPLTGMDTTRGHSER